MGHIMPVEELDAASMWVFGYGSLMWKTGFEYTSREVGYIKGFQRRFWQGNTTHRGTPDSPGRVAMLVEDEQLMDCDTKSNKVWGLAFELVGTKQIQNALEHLGARECRLGGYISRVLPFYPRGGDDTAVQNVLLFDATPENQHFLGPASVDALANQIAACKGAAGHNVEYVTALAEFVRRFIPEDTDEHLFELDARVREILRERQICLNCLINHSLPTQSKRKTSPTNCQVPTSRDLSAAGRTLKHSSEVHQNTRMVVMASLAG